MQDWAFFSGASTKKNQVLAGLATLCSCRVSGLDVTVAGRGGDD